MSRNEFFSGLYIVACANGIGLRAVNTVHQFGIADAFLLTFQVSGIVWAACAVGIWLILHDKTAERINSVDIAVGLGCLALVSLPIGPAIWIAVTLLSLYLISLTKGNSSRRRGAVILLATTAPMFWSPFLFQFFAEFILRIDASLVGWLLGTPRSGNLIQFADNSGYLVIFPACSSLANVSLAVLCWVMINEVAGNRWSFRALLWGFLACVSVVAVNIVRMSIMGLDHTYYTTLHSPSGDLAVNLVTLTLTVACCSLGAKHEIFARA